MASGRRNMVRSAARLLHSRGYRATGLSDVIVDSGAPRGSIYYYFPGGKDQLVAEAVEESGERLRRFLDETLGKAASPRQVIEVLAREAIDQLTRSDFDLGCPVALVALETRREVPDLCARCNQVFDSVEGVIRSHLERFLGSERAAELAPAVFAAFQGALLVSQARGDTSSLAAFARTFGELLDAGVRA